MLLAGVVAEMFDLSSGSMTHGGANQAVPSHF
jgi:hypothetical protein